MGLFFSRSIFATVLLFSLTVKAQENESRVKAEDVKEQHNQTPGDDVDDLITNRLLRAESGSKSRWSIASVLNYNGGSVQKPLAEDRPNIAAASGTIEKALLDGQVSMKYNLNTQASLLAGVGVRWIAPLSSHGPKDYHGDRFDADNPYVTYQYLYKWSGIQSVLQLQPVYYTNTNLKKEGYVSTLSLNQDNVFELGKSGISLALSLGVQLGYFNKKGPLGQRADKDYMEDVRTDQSDYQFWVDPIIEYTINDRFNFRTVTTLWNYEHLRSEARNTYRWDKVSQSVGIGISVTRDIFVYPNVQFLPDNVRSDLTNVALNTNLNVF